VSDAAFEAVRRESDPVERARLAGQLIVLFEQHAVELARLRREAIEEALEAGLVSSPTLCEELGLSQARLAQIRKFAPTAERALFGVGPVEIWIPERRLGDGQERLVAAEDQDAGEKVRDLLTRLQLSASVRHLPVDDSDWAPQHDAVVIGGPEVSPVVRAWLDRDPVATFVRREGLWRILLRSEEDRELTSPLEAGEPTDLAYLSKVTDEQGRVRVHLAGLHPIGALAAVEWLDQHTKEMWRTMRDRDFTAVISGDLEGSRVTRTGAVLPPRAHAG
jgi:hypothetical protein